MKLYLSSEIFYLACVKIIKFIIIKDINLKKFQNFCNFELKLSFLTITVKQKLIVIVKNNIL